MLPALKAVTGSFGSYPTITSSNLAVSATLRVIGPIVSCVNDTGIMPSRLINPLVGRSPTRLFSGSRRANRAARIRAGTRGREVGSNRSRRPTGRTARRPGEVVGIFHLAAQRAYRDASTGKFLQIGLAENEGAGVAKLLDRKSVLVRLRALQHQGTC